MNKLVFSCVLAVAAAAPLEDTPDVVAAKASFKAAFDLAAAGEHAKLAPVNNDVQAPQIANAYLDDVKEVADAKAAFTAYIQAPQIASAYLDDVEEVAAAKAAFDTEFKSVAAGGLAAKQAPAPVHVVPEPVVNKVEVPVAAPVAPVAYTAYHHVIPHTYAAYPVGASLYTHYPYTTYAHPYTYTLPHFGLVPTIAKAAEE